MSISPKLAELNVGRYKKFKTPFKASNASQAILTFKGDVYQDIEVDSYSKTDFNFADKHIRILSGLYGLLRPLDLMQPYRLEMKTKLKTERAPDLYKFWGDRITDALGAAVVAQKDGIVVNLASNEYFKAVNPKLLDAEIVTPTFKEVKNGKPRVIALFAKRARGAMANYMVKTRAKKVSDLKKFKVDGYRFSAADSTESDLVFLRS